jgi:DNA-binding LacI/PurR family transcriptional regulator
MDEMPVDYVAVDQAEGARIAVNHLIDNGHKRIGYLCCPDEQETGKTRREGFEQALFSHDIPLFGRDIIKGSVSKKGGYSAMKELLRQDKSKLPTAFFCHNDNVALGAMLAIQQAGYSVPEDFSLIGFDDIEESSLAFPPLTTVGDIKDKLAKELVDTVLNFVENKKESKRIKKEIIPKLVIRDTVKQLN